MIVIPSIDIKNGVCVRLRQGDFDQCTVYNEAPQKIAQTFFEKGVTTLHVVDLTGAQIGRISQLEEIQNIRTFFPGIIQIGGGIREESDIEKLLNLGIDRVVIGTRAIQDRSKMLQWFKRYGHEKIVLALDFKLFVEIPYLMANGWQKKTELTVWEVLKWYPLVSNVICTDIRKDGMQNGPNFTFYNELMVRHPQLKVQASGGISTIDDLFKLKNLKISGAIVGKAIYENKIPLQETIKCLKSE